MKRIFLIVMIMIGTLAFAQQKRVFIDFKYDNVTIETEFDESGQIIKRTVTEFGQSTIKNQYLDYLIFELKNREVNLVESKDNANITVSINPLIDFSKQRFIIYVETETLNGSSTVELIRGYEQNLDYLVNKTVEKTIEYLLPILK
jgi:hypothetical protein